MKLCKSCSRPIAEGNHFCGSCGRPTAGDRPTETRAPIFSSPSSEEARFLPGTTIGGRYRIVGLLGRGGMGEVYRADDLKLGQPVALKFLPAGLERDAGRLGRLLDEVRTALRITHLNVCRVYDLGEVDGQHFISMEYIDGEDVSSLLRRIGHLPGDKAVQIARQLCAGLAAAHDQGILHRDLKPANVMLDGRGQAKITDFGLAGLEQEFEGGALRAGTPAYMAPEQLEGKAVSPRSDLFALGLVLYELFTGKRVVEGRSRTEIIERRRQSTPTSLSSHVEGIDPAVERVILQCLENDPAARPASAQAVAAALPGGDPLAAALAAGETPSPEMVAAAGDAGTLPISHAVRYLALIAVGMVVWVLVSHETAPHKIAPLESSPEVLAHRAREILETFGVSERPRDRVFGFEWNQEYADYALERSGPSRRFATYQGYDRPSVLRFWYRQGPTPLLPVAGSVLGVLRDRVTPSDPPLTEPGMAIVMLSPGGHLTRFTYVPLPFDEPEASMDWARVFEQAGLDSTRFTEVEPTLVPPVGFDDRKAWVGSYPDAAELEMRVSAASLAGRPVHFETSGPWDPRDNAEAIAAADAARRKAVLKSRVLMAFLAVVLVGIAVLARRNTRLGRGDRRGALRIGLYLWSTNLVFWLFWADHAGELGADGFAFLAALIWALGRAVFAAVGYLAIEPYVRKSWPNLLVSWNRLLAGRLRDPLIGRDVLFGLSVNVVVIAFLSLYYFLLLGGPTIGSEVVDALSSPRYAVAHLFGDQNATIAMSFSMVFLVLLSRAVLRNVWLASLVFLAALSTLFAIALPFDLPFWFVLPPTAMIVGAQLYLIYRGSLTALLVSNFFGPLLTNTYVTADLDMWYVPGQLLVLGVAAAVAAYGFRIATCGQTLFGEDRA